MRAIVLKGGPDAEREVSIKSGAQVAAALARANVDVQEITIDRLDIGDLRNLVGDVIFPVLHGPWGEGGPLQDILEQDGRPYVGCGPAAARLAMDKTATKKVVARAGVPTPDSCELQIDRPITIKLPCVIKPSNDGSSVDLKFATRPRNLPPRVNSLKAIDPGSWPRNL